MKRSLKHDPEILKCIKNLQLTSTTSAFDDATMLIGKSSGNTLENHFNLKFSKCPDDFTDLNRCTVKNYINNLNKFNKVFYEFMLSFRNIYKGLEILNEFNIIHLDIKGHNILFHQKDNMFKLIDFGTSVQLENEEFYKQRSIDERSDILFRYYIPYPLEYLIYYDGEKDKNNFKNNIINNNIWLNERLGNYKYIHNIKDNVQLKKHLISICDKSKNDNIVDLLLKLDIYSMGMIIPNLFYNLIKKQENKVYKKFINKSIIYKDFYKLFKKMIEPDYNNRINSKDLIIEYDNIIDKYKNKYKKLYNKIYKEKLLPI